MTTVTQRRVDPTKDPEVRARSLRLANEVRFGRAQIKRDVRAGRRRLDRSLLEEPYLRTMKLYDLLRELPKVGRVKANRLLYLCRISTGKTIGGLSERQRDEVVRGVAERWW